MSDPRSRTAGPSSGAASGPTGPTGVTGPTGPTGPTPHQALLASRIVAAAMLLGGVVVAAVGAAVILGQDRAPTGGGAATALFGAWVALGILGTVGWGRLSRRAAELGQAPREGTAPGREGRILRLLVSGWALLEAQLMVALVASILGRTPMLLIPALAIFAIGILLSFPRREWFAPEARRI